MADRFWGELSKLFDRNLEGLIATVFLLLVIEGRVYRFRYVSLPFFSMQLYIASAIADE